MAEDSSDFDADDIDENGNLSVELSGHVPESGPVAGAPGCPNGNWTQFREVDLESLTVEIDQGRKSTSETCDFVDGELDCNF